ncbi:leguminosin group486 secreted peptide [Medicago truncatula]|uniref:Leguminosin group486 secreted peptide n=1 Tax=Medicago truncatula TaxID=3880 RepID=A0A072U898_MEDTR|nr:leguminosin group486 secreted peptide [Medicago truncatula]
MKIDRSILGILLPLKKALHGQEILIVIILKFISKNEIFVTIASGK